MENRYQHGKVYKMISTDGGVYIGSTCSPLSKRKYKHRMTSRKQPDRKVYKHINASGWNGVRIVLVEEFPCENVEQLRAREQLWIDEMRPTLNSQKAVYHDCEHGTRESRCRPCNGASICHHGKHKYHCKLCGGSGICQHNKYKAFCRDCGGSQICEHNKYRSSCKACNGDKYHCFECELSFNCQQSLDYHDSSQKHLKTYTRRIEEVFGKF